MTREGPARIRWAPRLRPLLLKRLYDSDVQGFQDVALCDDVGTTLFSFHIDERTETATKSVASKFLEGKQEGCRSVSG